MLARAFPAVAATTRALSEQSFLGEYVPSTNVDNYAALDIDHRSILARLATGDEEGLLEAEVVYSQGPGGENKALTLQSLSTKAQEELIASSTYRTFVEYYGEADYADAFIQASFGGETLSLGKGDYNLGNFDVEGRAATIRWGIPLMHIWMYVVGLLEKAAANCDASGGSNADQIADWDKAVALYVGSEAREAGTGGHSLYTLTQVECYKFGTCKKGDESPVNVKILEGLSECKSHFETGNCEHVANNAKEMKSLMTVLLVQGLLRAMYALDIQDDFQETTQGMGTAFGSAILPLVNACSEGNAHIIFTDLAPGKSLTSSYEVVKEALSRSYGCLGISCDDIGGLVDLRGSGYLLGAEACGYVQPISYGNNKPSVYNGKDKADTPTATSTQSESESYKESGNVNLALTVGLSIGTLVLGVLLGFCLARMCAKKKKEDGKEFVTSSNNNVTLELSENGEVL